jgi:hypothetical protein
LAAALALLAGCTPSLLEEPKSRTPPPAAASQPPPPAPVTPVAPVARPAPATPVPAPRDACGAAELQGLVGRPRTEIPVPVDPNRQRVACTTCPVTQDHRPDRLNFFFDAQSGLIREIRCG